MNRTPVTIAPAFVAALLLSIVSITGCAGPGAEPVDSPAPTAAASETPTPTPEPVAEAALVTIAASGVTVTDADAVVLLQVAYSADPDVVVAQLSEALGEPATALVNPASTCSAETTVTRWGGLYMYDPAGVAHGPGALYTIGANAATTASGVPIAASPGFSVGDPIGDVTALGGISTVDYVEWISVFSDLQVASFDDPDAWGVSAVSRAGSIEAINAPIYYYYDC